MMRFTLYSIMLVLAFGTFGLSRSGLLWSQLQPLRDVQRLSDAVRKHPNSLVGFTLFTKKAGYKAKRAMILDVETGNIFDICPSLRDAPQVTSQFVGWLGGHGMAIVQVGIYPQSIDQYVVDLTSGRFFVPTVVDQPLGSPLFSVDLYPYKNANKEEGYFFALEINGRTQTQTYTMRLDGTAKAPLKVAATLNTHGCSILPDLSVMACEITCGLNSAKTCVQTYDVSTGQPIGRPLAALAGIAIWSPDGKRFAYPFGDDSYHLKFATEEYKNAISQKLGRVDHVLAPYSGTDPSLIIKGDEQFQTGSDLGAWSATPGEGAFYFSAIQPSGSKPQFNQVGRVLLADPDKFEELSPACLNARYPAPALDGSSVAYAAVVTATHRSGSDCIPNGPDESTVQIYVYDQKKNKNEQKTHFPKDWVPGDLKWAAMTTVAVPPFPTHGPGTGSFSPANCGSIRPSNDVCLDY